MPVPATLGGGDRRRRPAPVGSSGSSGAIRPSASRSSARAGLGTSQLDRDHEVGAPRAAARTARAASSSLCTTPATSTDESSVHGATGSASSRRARLRELERLVLSDGDPLLGPHRRPEAIAPADELDGCREPRRHTETLHRLPDVRLDGRFAQHQAAGDRVRVETASDEVDDLDLASGERRHAVRRHAAGTDSPSRPEGSLATRRSRGRRPEARNSGSSMRRIVTARSVSPERRAASPAAQAHRRRVAPRDPVPARSPRGTTRRSRSARRIRCIATIARDSLFAATKFAKKQPVSRRTRIDAQVERGPLPHRLDDHVRREPDDGQARGIPPPFVRLGGAAREPIRLGLRPQDRRFGGHVDRGESVRRGEHAARSPRRGRDPRTPARSGTSTWSRWRGLSGWLSRWRAGGQRSRRARRRRGTGRASRFLRNCASPVRVPSSRRPIDHLRCQRSARRRFARRQLGDEEAVGARDLDGGDAFVACGR